MTKTCNHCKSEKPLEEFAFRSIQNNIRLNTCKECHRNYTKDHYKRNRKKYVERARATSLERGRRNTESRQRKMLDFLRGKKCAECGEADIVLLEFDHREGEKKEASISVLMTKSWKKTIAEISKCDILCVKCHRIKTAKQFGWYRYVNSRRPCG